MTKPQTVALVIIMILLCVIATKIYAYKQHKIATLTHCPIILKAYHKVVIQKDNPLVILLGDSRIKDWGKPYLGSNVTVENQGFGGETSFQALCRLDDIISLEPELFILQVGINDIVAISLLPTDLQPEAQSQSLAQLKKIITTISKSKSNLLLLTITPPISANFAKRIIWGKHLTETTEYYNQILLTEIPEQITVLNMKDIFFDNNTNTWDKSYSRDALHWNTKAYQTLTIAVQNILSDHPSLLREKCYTTDSAKKY